MHKAIKYLVVGGLSVLSLLLIWGLIEPYVIAVEHDVAPIPGLPAAWDGQRIGVLADFQVGMWLDNVAAVRGSVTRLVAERPAAVLIAGDFIYGPSDDIAEDAAEVAALVRPLVDAGIPTYAVLGNHDYGLAEAEDVVDQERAQAVRAALAQIGVTLLHNEAQALPPPTRHAPAAGAASDSALYVVGVGDRWANEDDPLAALAQVPATAPRIALMHNPDTFPDFPAGSAPVAIAGHTHGGQVRIPFTPSWSWMSIVKADEVHVDSWIDGFGAAGNHLYVNRGIGFSIAPIRINCRPELTLLTLQPAP
jgi:hypothetical protein